MAELLDEAARRPERLAQGAGPDRRRQTAPARLLVRIAAERDGGDISGFVVTFDDITELLSAQRKAAWADIARRIAHEIKNPLTPIQLAAERLRRKYLQRDQERPGNLHASAPTRSSGMSSDIGRMVDEFSSFARMPAPVLKPEDLVEIVEQAVFLQRTAHPEIAFETALRRRPVIAALRRAPGRPGADQHRQERDRIDRGASRRGRRRAPGGPDRVAVAIDERRPLVVAVEDNGKGCRKQGRERLTEPYVTTRAKGTGLGLAIVKKIMEDHQGELVLEDRRAGGARGSGWSSRREARAAPRPDPPTAPTELSTVDHGA